MTEVQTLEELLEVVPRNLLTEFSWVGNEVEKFTSLSKFENDIADFFLSSIVLFVDSMSSLNLFNNIDVF